MAGLRSRKGSSIVSAGDQAPLVDNYAVFFQRIEDAQNALRSKMSQNERRISFLRQQLTTAEASLTQWSDNVSTVDRALAVYDGDAKGYEYLAGLLESARTMASAAQSQSTLIESAIVKLEEQEAPLLKNLNSLTAAKGKLMRTQSLERAQRDLSNVVRNTGGGGITHAEPLDEMREIRRLVAETEALVELKG